MCCRFDCDAHTDEQHGRRACTKIKATCRLSPTLLPELILSPLSLGLPMMYCIPEQGDHTLMKERQTRENGICLTVWIFSSRRLEFIIDLCGFFLTLRRICFEGFC